MKLRSFVVAALAGLAAFATVARADAPEGMYTDTTDGSIAVVVDNQTGLTWMQAASPDLAVADAGAWCTTNGGAGWDVPTYQELSTLVDESRRTDGTSLIDAKHFPGTAKAQFWTSSIVASNGKPIVVGFDGLGSGVAGDTVKMLPVRCVKRP